MRVQVNGRRRDIGLGELRHVSLRDARLEAAAIKKLAQSRIDPLEDRIKQCLVVEGLCRKRDRPVFHRPDQHGDVAMPGNEDHRQADPERSHLLLAFEPALSGYAHVEDQAPRRVRAASRG